MVGEAYAVRALAYFDLVKFFARPLNHTSDGSHLGVPLVLLPITSISEVVYPARNTAKEVYDRISLDIEEALKRLPASGNVLYNGTTNSTLQKIRFNRFSALALKARVAIYTENWQAAIDASNLVIASGKYTLYPYGSMVQDFRTQNSAESIFEIANKTDVCKNPGYHNKDKDQKNAEKEGEDVNLLFTQLEGKCHCCGKVGKKSLPCCEKKKPKGEWAINQAP